MSNTPDARLVFRKVKLSDQQLSAAAVAAHNVGYLVDLDVMSYQRGWAFHLHSSHRSPHLMLVYLKVASFLHGLDLKYRPNPRLSPGFITGLEEWPYNVARKVRGKVDKLLKDLRATERETGTLQCSISLLTLPRYSLRVYEDLSFRELLELLEKVDRTGQFNAFISQAVREVRLPKLPVIKNGVAPPDVRSTVFKLLDLPDQLGARFCVADPFYPEEYISFREAG